MKKYWILSAAVAVVIGTTLLLVFNKDQKDKASGQASAGDTSKLAVNIVDRTSTTEKAEEIIEDIKRVYKPEWDKVNELADKRLSELLVQAQKEYNVKKERNQDVSRIEDKYRNLYNDYEQDTKTRVDNLISSMQKEVIKKELNNNIGEEYFELYRIQKEKRIEKVISELKKLS